MNPSSQSLGLRNTFVRLSRDRKLKVIVVGNSVTYGAPAGETRNPSFYVALEEWLRSRFPDAQIEVKTKIIFAMGSEVQLFRMDERVIAEEPDLVLAEFNAANGAANSAWKTNGPPVTSASMEGFVRRLRLYLPKTDCLLELGYHDSMFVDFHQGHPPVCSSFQHEVAAHYNCIYADAAQAVVDRVMAGESASTYMKDPIHPSAEGYEVYSRVLLDEMERQWTLFQALPEAEQEVKPHAFPPTTVYPEPWLFPRLVPAAFHAEFDDGFTIQECGRVKYLAANRAGASGRYRVAPPARIVGILCRRTEPAGNLEVQVGDQWLRLSQKEPRYYEENDPDNRFYRNFFQYNHLPPEMESVNFRVSNEPENAGAFDLEVFGFFVIERPAAIAFQRP
jgi:lysophospholipase L1-like esterase